MTRIVQFWSFDPIRHQPLLASLPELVKSLYENNRSMGDHKIDGRPFFMHKVDTVQNFV